MDTQRTEKRTHTPGDQAHAQGHMLGHMHSSHSARDLDVQAREEKSESLLSITGMRPSHKVLDKCNLVAATELPVMPELHGLSLIGNNIQTLDTLLVR